MRFSETTREKLMPKIIDNKLTYDLCVKEKRKKSFLVEGESLELIINDKTMQKLFVDMS